MEKYYLRAGYQTAWSEVTREQFIAAEQAAGFRSKFGDDQIATSGFSGRGMQGRVQYVEQSCTEQPANAAGGEGDYDQMTTTRTENPWWFCRCGEHQRCAAKLHLVDAIELCPCTCHEHEPPAPAAPETGEQWYLIPDEGGNYDIYTTSGERVARATSMAYGQQIVRDHNSHPSLTAQRERLRAAVQKFVAAYTGPNAGRLGNGQARRSLDEFRAILNEQRSES